MVISFESFNNPNESQLAEITQLNFRLGSKNFIGNQKLTFISYAQNFEDVMLRRAFKLVDKGFYIDVGANDPIVDSVTKAFYLAGWRGINIEPVGAWYKKIKQDRPDDINLQVALGARKGNLDFYEVVGTGLSTLKKSIAERHAQEHGFKIKNYKVSVVRLTTICAQHAQPDIHFLKIDVEGAEQSVLRGLDLKKIRPWIILVESTLPSTQTENFESWEHSLTERGYHHVYFDGLNRYYVADEHNELDAAFTSPPNNFDNFKRASEYSLEQRAQRLQKKWDAAKSSINEMDETAVRVATTMQNTEQQRQQLETKLQTLQVEAGRQDGKLREKEAKQQELLLSLMEKENKLLEVAATLADSRQQIGKLHVSLADSKERCQALKTTLQNTEQRRQQLETKLQAEADKRVNLLREKDDATDLLSNELSTANSKIDELYQLIHHWWSESERFNEELQTIYQSKSWPIIWPLRKLMQFFRWLLSLSIRLITLFMGLSKMAIRWLMVKSMAYALFRPGLKVRAMVWLRNHPTLEAKLRRLAQMHGLIAAQPDSLSMPDRPVLESPDPIPTSAGNATPASVVNLSHLSPEARYIYGELKAAIAQSAGGRTGNADSH